MLEFSPFYSNCRHKLHKRLDNISPSVSKNSKCIWTLENTWNVDNFIVTHFSWLRLELSSVVLVWVEVWCDNHTVIELPPCQWLLCLLTINNGIELYEHLKTLQTFTKCLGVLHQGCSMYLQISVFHRAFFNSIIDKHQHVHFFTFKTVLRLVVTGIFYELVSRGGKYVTG